jgi:hypothetical protein
MYKISRAYAGNFGYRDAWYDGITFDFTNPFTGEPAHTILKAPNGTGKTSLLGFVFSCFEPSIKRFLPHLNDPSRHFHHYFDPHGQPAIALIEFLLPSHTGKAGQRLIVGQVCAMHAGQPSRTFFSFEEVEGLKFELVPAPKLRNDGRVARAMEDFGRWAQEMRSKYPGNFQAFDSQAKWQEHLDRERGLDPYIFRVQLELSRREGAVDEGFLRFGSEADFLKMFFGMVLSEERGMKVREAVSVACQKLKDYPEYEKRLAALQRLATEIVPFSQAAAAFAVASSSVTSFTKQAVRTSAALDKIQRNFDEAHGRETQLAQVQSRAHKLHMKEAEVAAGTVEALQAEHLNRAAVRSKASEKEASDERANAERAIQYVDAAQVLERVDEANAKVARVTRQIREAAQGLADFEREARDAGTLLRYALEIEEANARDKVHMYERMAKATSAEADRIEDENRKLEVEALQLARTRGALEQLQSQLEDGLAEFAEEGLINRAAGERAAEAITRHTQASMAARVDRDRLAQTARARREHSENLTTQIAGERQQLGQLGAEKQAVDTDYGDGIATRDELAELPVLCEAAGSADHVDPESASIMLALETFITRIAAELARLNVRRAELGVDERSLEATELASAGADVEVAVEHLKALGVGSARAFVHYIAKVEPDAKRARALVLSNPGRYLGVAVGSLEELTNARALLERPPLVSRPVTVSLCTDQPDLAPQNQFVVPPATDAAYNFDAADELARRLRGEAEELRSQLDRMHLLQEKAIQAKQALINFVSTYGNGRLAALKAEAERLAGEIQAIDVRIGARIVQVTNANSEAEKLELGARDKSTESEKLTGWAARLTAFHRTFEAGEAQRKAQIAQATRRLTVIEAQKTVNIDALKAARARAESEGARARQAKIDRESFAVELAGIALYHADMARAKHEYGSDPQVVALYRERYSHTKSTYETKVEERLGRLRADLEHAQQDVKHSTAEYKARFPDLEDFHSEAKCLIGVDYRDERLKRQQRYEEKDNAFNAAVGQRALAEERETSHQKSRIYPDVVVLGADQFADDVLAGRRDEAEVTQRQIIDRAAVAKAAADAAGYRAQQNQQWAAQTATAARSLAGLLRGYEPVEPDEALVTKGVALVEDAPSLVQALSDARNQCSEMERRSRQAYERMMRVVRTEAFTAALPTLAGQLATNSFEVACQDYAGLSEAIEQQIAATRAARDAVQADFDACLNELHGFSTEALEALRTATRKRLPDAVPHYGGKEVLLMKNMTSALTAEARRSILKGYLETLIADKRIPQDGAHLAADAMVVLHGGQALGLKVIRVTQHARLDYDDIAKIASSGGEKVTAAMLLYFVVVKLRAENRARRAEGGPLILDNPFAKMNLESLWRTVRSLADAVGVQCIFATILEDKNALSVFDRLIELRAGPVNKRTDRRHVEAVDVTFRAPAAA